MGDEITDAAVADPPAWLRSATASSSTTRASSRHSSRGGAAKPRSAPRSTSASTFAAGERSCATPSGSASARASISARGSRRLAEERLPDGGFILAVFAGDEPVEVLLERAGTMPVPPYIAGKRATDDEDRADWQTMFAREDGAVAAPTAALHFTPGLPGRARKGGHRHRDADAAEDVDAGTFLPVRPTTPKTMSCTPNGDRSTPTPPRT